MNPHLDSRHAPGSSRQATPPTPAGGFSWSVSGIGHTSGTSRSWRHFAPLLAFVVLLALASAAYAASTVSVTLEADGREQVIETRTGTVGDLLAEHGIELEPDDLVQPPPAARLHQGDRVRVQRAVDYVVRADGRLVRLRTHAATAHAVLEEAGIELQQGDLVLLNGVIVPPDAPMDAGVSANGADGLKGNADTHGDERTDKVVLEVFHSRSVTVEENGIPVEVTMAGATIGQGLEHAGIHVYDEDLVWPSREAPLEGTAAVIIERAVPFVVNADGETRHVRAVADTIGEGLDSVGLGLNAHDYSIPEAESQLLPNMEVQVVRVVEDILVQEVAIPYATDLRPNSEMVLDSKQVVRPGKPGRKTQHIRITYEDGEEVDREVIEETVLEDPVTEIVDYGTRIIWQTVDTPDGPIRYWRKMRAYTTSYSPARSGTPRSAPWYGLTRLGWRVTRGVIATDPRVIALGTHMYVPGYGPGVAADTGGGVRNYLIDLGFEDDKYEHWHGWREIYLTEPLPPEDEIRWVLP